MSKIRIKSGFALLDVEQGRGGLRKEVKERRVPVTIRGKIVGVWGHDDGKSQEFEVDVESVDLDT